MLRVKVLLVAVIIAAVAAASACTAGDLDGASSKRAKKSEAQRQKTNEVAAKKDAHGHDDGHGHDHGAPGEVPAFQTDPADLKSLPPTLSPELFAGKQRQGYEAAKAIPQTLAQLPCYCHCDKGFGHKSLHTCFVDDHAAHCAVCIDEALLAYQLQKGEGLRPEQIRERIIAQYTNRL